MTPALAVVPDITPADLRPVADRPGTTWRFYVVDHTTLILRARLKHDAAPAPIGATPMHTALLLKNNLPAFHGVAHLYHLRPALSGHEYVVVSALEAPHHDPKAGGTAMHYETFIFASDASGELTESAELPGSTTGTLDHREALLGAGYEVTA